MSGDGLKERGVIREDRPVYVRVCDRCREGFRTNDRGGWYCDGCEDELVANEVAAADWMEEG
jgi:hypothetical protein